MKQIIIEGNSFTNLEGFYDEIERKFTKGYDWEFGRNLKAVKTILKGGLGVHDYGDSIEIMWKDTEKSKIHLGNKETVKYLKKQLKTCHFSERKTVLADFEKAKKGVGKTVFDMVKELLESIENVQLKVS